MFDNIHLSLHNMNKGLRVRRRATVVIKRFSYSFLRRQVILRTCIELVEVTEMK